MQNKTIFGILALMIVGIVGAGLVSAHGRGSYSMMGGYGGMMGGYGMMNDYGTDMHDNVDQIMESGSYSDLQSLREEYQMPIMDWVESEDDFSLARQMHDKFEDSSYDMKEYDNMPCHGWN